MKSTETRRKNLNKKIKEKPGFYNWNLHVSRPIFQSRLFVVRKKNKFLQKIHNF